MRVLIQFYVFLMITICCVSCNHTPSITQPTTFGFYGHHSTRVIESEGKQIVDTTYHIIPPFQFVNQDSQEVTRETFDKKIYIANFFFTSCPSICPIMTNQMKRVQSQFSPDSISFLSFSIDPIRDSVQRLKYFSDKYGLDNSNWHLVTGDKEAIYEVGLKGFIVNAMEDSTADGGYLHSEHFILIDRQQHIRGIYNGTETQDINRLIADLRQFIPQQYE